MYNEGIQNIIKMKIEMEEPFTKDEGLDPPFISGLAKDIVDLVIAMSTQMNYVGLGMEGVMIMTGFDYKSLDVVAKAHKVKLNSFNLSLFRVAENIIKDKINTKKG